MDFPGPATFLADLDVTPSICRFVQYHHVMGVIIVTPVPASFVQASPGTQLLRQLPRPLPENSRSTNRNHTFHVFGPGNGCTGHNIVGRDISHIEYLNSKPSALQISDKHSTCRYSRTRLILLMPGGDHGVALLSEHPISAQSPNLQFHTWYTSVM
jgi:hypothetical protein